MEYTPKKGEINNSPSETVQGQSLSVNEILIKFTQGTLGDIVHDHYYDEDPNFDDIDPTLSPDFDLSDTDIYRDFKISKEELTEPENTLKKDSESKQPKQSTEETEKTD